MKRVFFAKIYLVTLVACFLMGQCSKSNLDVDELEKLLSDIEMAWAKMSKDHPMPFDWLLQDLVSRFINQKPSNENGTRSEFKTFVLSDNSNDDATMLTAQQQELITRSGFKFELHQAVADDGYVTALIRLVNPLANLTKLRRPPVLLEHGGTIDTTAYLMASSIQHHPEPWPRLSSNGPFTSWNRSLAFVLANNGFDCWLAETRGSNERNLKRVQPRVEPLSRRNLTASERDDALELISNGDYWSFSQDDIINYELKSHMDKVTNVTGAEKLHIMTHSLSTSSSLAFFSTQPNYARKVQALVSMSPIVTGDGLSLILKGILNTVCPNIPDVVGHILFTTLFTSQRARDLLILAARNKIIRYSVLKAVIIYFLGPSAKYQTHLELNVLGHMFRKLSFKEVKQACADRLQMFDYGPNTNKRLYNSSEPPVYDLSNLEISDWIVISGENDKLATLEMAHNLIKLVNPKPAEHIIVPGFNHLDMLAGHENDKYINLPILDYFAKMSLVSFGEFQSAASARAFNFSMYLPPNFNLDIIQNSLKNVTNALKKPEVLIESIQKSFTSLLDGLSQTFTLSLPTF